MSYQNTTTNIEDGLFLVCAMNDRELYQLEKLAYISGRSVAGYGVCRVKKDGGFVRCKGEGFPAPCSDLRLAIQQFCEWAGRVGLEVRRNLCRPVFDEVT